MELLFGLILICVTELFLLLKMRIRGKKLGAGRTSLQNVLDSSSTVAIIATDRSGLITVFNVGAERMLGYSAAEMVGKLSPQAFHKGEEVEARSAELSAAYGRPIRGFEVFTVEALKTGHEEREWTYVRKDGAEITVSLVITVLTDAKGNLLGMLGVATDITARKRAEEELVREKALIEAIFNSVPGMLYLYDFDGNLVRWNRKHETMTGYDPEEMSRMTLLDWYKGDEEGQKAVLAGVKHTAETGFGEVEANLQRKDGTTVPMYFTACPLTLLGKLYFVGLGIDISSRKREESLREIRLRLFDFSADHSLEELLKKALDEVTEFSGSRIGFYHILDEDRKTILLQAWSTRTFEEFCGAKGRESHYSLDEAGVWADCVRKRAPVIHNDYASLPDRKGLPQGHATIVRELTVPVIKNGKIVAVLGVGNKETDYTDEDVRLISYLADVSWEIVGKKRTEEALTQSEAKLAALFASMSEMVALHQVVFDDAGKPVNYRITDCNDAYTRITGIRREDAVGRLADEAYGTPEAPYLAEFSKVALSGEPYRYETYFPPMDKHFAVSVVSPSRNTFATVTSDITQMKRIQEVIDAKNKELEQIVYVASHDLRSPLVNVAGFGRELEYSLADLKSLLEGPAPEGALEAKLRGELPDMEKSVGRIRVGASQMDKLLQGLLRLSREGRASLMIEDIDMDRLVARLASSLAFTLKEERAELTVGSLPPCRGDAVQLTQVFANLVNNAIKYRDPERQPKIRLTGAMVTDKAVYRVEDNGIGIAENHLGHVFELFHRLDPGKTEGEGLGLTIARQALSRMYGEIRVESELGKGSAFIVTMPPARDNARGNRDK